MKVENFQKITQTTFNFLNCKCCIRRLYLITSKDYFSKVKNVFSFFGLLDVIFITQILILILIILILMKFDELISCTFRMVIDSVDPLKYLCIIRGPRCTLFSKSNKKSFCFNVFIIQPHKVKYT